MRVKPAKPRAFLDWSAFTDRPFAIFVFCTMLGFIGNYVTLFFISYFSEATHIASKMMAFYLIPIVNAESAFGRTIPNAISDYTGPISSESPIMLILSSAHLHYSIYPCCYCLRYLDHEYEGRGQKYRTYSRCGLSAHWNSATNRLWPL
jgi:hypothetical protein